MIDLAAFPLPWIVEAFSGNGQRLSEAVDLHSIEYGVFASPHHAYRVRMTIREPVEPFWDAFRAQLHEHTSHTYRFHLRGHAHPLELQGILMEYRLLDRTPEAMTLEWHLVATPGTPRSSMTHGWPPMLA